MRILLDTQAFLWFITDDPKLSAVARSLIENPDNDRLLSIASLWEIAIKMSLGKLELEKPEEFGCLVEEGKNGYSGANQRIGKE